MHRAVFVEVQHRVSRAPSDGPHVQPAQRPEGPVVQPSPGRRLRVAHPVRPLRKLAPTSPRTHEIHSGSDVPLYPELRHRSSQDLRADPTRTPTADEAKHERRRARLPGTNPQPRGRQSAANPCTRQPPLNEADVDRFDIAGSGRCPGPRRVPLTRAARARAPVPDRSGSITPRRWKRDLPPVAIAWPSHAQSKGRRPKAALSTTDASGVLAIPAASTFRTAALKRHAGILAIVTGTMFFACACTRIVTTSIPASPQAPSGQAATQAAALPSPFSPGDEASIDAHAIDASQGQSRGRSSAAFENDGDADPPRDPSSTSQRPGSVPREALDLQ